MPPPTKSRRAEASLILSNLVILLIANATTVYLFTTQHSSVWQVLLTYYIQTALIVFFYYKRIFGADVTQIAYRLRDAPLFRKVSALQSEAASEQFLFLFTFGTPVALMLFIILLNYSGNTLFGAIPINIHDINPWSVLIASLLFLFHHIVSYAFEQWEFRTGRIPEVTLPIVRIAVRVLTLLALIFFMPIVFKHGQINALFYVFMGIKTLLDIVLSSSYILLQTVAQRNE